MSTIDALDVDQAGLLSDATLSALQLRLQPFTTAPTEGEWFNDDINSEQLEDIKEALINGDDLLLVVGDDGAGKTTLLTQLGANSGLRIQCFSVKGSPRFSTRNLFAGMLEAFKRKPPDDLKLALDELIPCLQGMNNRNTLSAIVIDDADQVPEPELTRLLSAMLYMNSRDETLLRVALAARADIESRIPELLPEGADLPYSTLSIEPLDSERTAAYLGYRLNQAGLADEFPFNEAEVARIQEQSFGLPAAMHAAAADELNGRHGPVIHSLPPELVKRPAASLLHSKTGKLVLGLLAGLMIIGGLLMFLKPDPPSTDTAGTQSVEERSVDNQREAERLRTLAEEESARAIDNAQRQANENATAAEQAAATPLPANDAGGADTESAQAAQLESGANAGAVSSATKSAETGQTPNDTAADNNTTEAAATDESAAEPTASDVSAGEAAATDEATAEAATDVGADADTPAATSTTGTESATASDAATGSDSADAAADSPQAKPAPANDSMDMDTAAAVETEESAAPPASSKLESANWILVQLPDQYTVQLSASTDLKSVEEFLARNDLDPPNSIYSFKRKGVTWYALVHGLYPSINKARAAIEGMPKKARSNQPWIRAVSRVQKALKDQN
jgi:DamX protein